MRILVCVKRVPITGGRMVLTDDGQAIQTRHLGFTISPHEECGVEEAVRIVEREGGEVVVLTLGPAEAVEQLREAMAIGGGRARCEQEVPGGLDVYEVPLPAVVTVKEGLNLPRYPSVPAKLRANRKPVEARAVERPAPRLEKLRLVVPEGQGKQAEILGHGVDAVPRVVEVMQQLGVA